MKEKILFINSPLDKRYFVSAQPPLGILSIAAVLRENGFIAVVEDGNLMPDWRRRIPVLVHKHVPSVVGISSAFSNHGAAVEIAGLVKQQDRSITVVAGGPHPTIAPLEYRNENIDYLIPYEGENVMLDFMLAADRDSLPGVISVRHGNIEESYRRAARNTVNNLDGLPFPAFDLVDIRRYAGSLYKKKPMVTLVTSRGCPYGCIFCSQIVFGNRWRGQSAERIVEQMILLKGMGVGEVLFEDDNFAFDINRVYRLCELINSKKLVMAWQANGIRADSLSRDLLRAMRDAGCWKISVGPEVGDEEELRQLGKGMTLEHFRRAAAWCKETGMAYVCFFMMGFPFQDRAGLEKTIRFALELDPLIMDLNKIMPLAGTGACRFFPENAQSRERVSFNERSDNRLLERMFRKAHLVFYLRPRKIAQIIGTVGIRRFLGLVSYAARILAA